ncbi:MAG: WD40 repeat domain-containing protein [Pirellulaceae bacterium]
MLLLDHGGAGPSCLSFSPDSRMLAVCDGSRVSVWNHLTGDLLHQPRVRHTVSCLVFTTPRNLVLAGGAISRWTPSRAATPWWSWPMGLTVAAVCASPSGRNLYVAANRHRDDCGMVVRSSSSGSVSRQLFLRGTAVFDATVHAPTNRVAVAASGMLLQWNAMAPKDSLRSWTQRIPADQPSRSSIPSIARLVGDGGGEILGVEREFRSVVYSPDGRLLAAAAGESVEVWDAHDARRFETLAHHDAEVRAVAWSPDGRWLASGGDDETVVLHDVARRRIVARYNWGVGRVRAIAFAPDGMTVAAACDQSVAVWDVEEPSSC